MKLEKYTQSKIKSIVTFFAILVVAIALFAFGPTLVTQAQDLADQKQDQAKSMELPTAEFKAEPSYLVKKGGEVSLFATFQNYAGEGAEVDNILYNWCIDSIPMNGILAGSTDKVFDENGFVVRNQYGTFSGGQGSCKISTIFDPNDLRIVYDAAAGADTASKRLAEHFTHDDNAAVENAALDEFIARLGRVNPSFKQLSDTLKSFTSLPDDQKDQFRNQLKSELVAGSATDIQISNFYALKSNTYYEALRKQDRDAVTVTRVPKTDDDIDGDGMSDAWELQHFGRYAGKEVELKDPTAPKTGFLDYTPQILKDVFGYSDPSKVQVAAINFNGSTPQDIYGAFLESIKPEHDYDGDGFLWGENYGACVENFFNSAPQDSQVRKIFEGESCWVGQQFASLPPNWNKELYVGQGFAGKTLAPGLVTEAWQVGIPYPRLSGQGVYKDRVFKIEKGSFSNAAEFVYGTNPVEADTDADGIPDAYDVAGLKQSSIPIEIQKDDDYEIDVHLYGKTQKGSLSRGPDAATKKGYNNTPYLFWRTDLESQKLKVGGGLPLPTQLAYSPFPITAKNVGCAGNLCSEPVRVEAAAVTGDVGTGSLFYTWYLDGIMLAADEKEIGKNSPGAEKIGYLAALQDRSDFSESNTKNRNEEFLTPSGYGKNVFEFSAKYGEEVWKKLNVGKSANKLGPCAVRKVGVDVLDDETGKTSYAEIEIPFGADVDLSEKLISNIDPSKDELLIGFNLNDASLNREIENDVIIPQLKDGIDTSSSQAVSDAILNQNFKDDASATGQVDPKKGYRRGDMVSVAADLDQTDSVCPAGHYEKLVHKWYFDDLFLEDKSGKGKDSIVVAMSNTGTELRDQNDSGSHYLRYEAVNPATNEIFARTIKELRVVSPFIDISVDGAQGLENFSSDGSTTSEGNVIYKVVPGQTVKVKASPKYFRPLSSGKQGLGYEYEWRRNGDLVENASRVVQGQTPAEVEYEFTIPNEEDVYEDITLEVRTADDTNREGESSSKESAVVAVQFTTAEISTVPIGEDGAASAMISRFIPDKYREAFNGAFIFGGFALLSIIALMLYKGKIGAEK